LHTILASICILAANQCSFSQLPGAETTTKPQSGIASGTAHAPVLDAKHRPITAGGFVDGAPIVFADITKQAGLDKFHHKSGTPEKTTIVETPGSGVALLDYDNDGWLDIYLVNGSTVAARSAGGRNILGAHVIGSKLLLCRATGGQQLSAQG
jgi:hypothetical protein